MTPLRLSFSGGGTDISAFYERHGGAVVSSTINQYVYVTVKRHSPLFNEAYRLSYTVTEHVQSLDEIENDIARECLRLVPVDPPLFIVTAADLPSQSGLGSSSSFAVGLLYALHLMRGEQVSAAQLAEEACQVEIGMLGQPIGKQDQYAAAFGGLNHISFLQGGRVEIDALWLPKANDLFSHSMLFWTGVQRKASDILTHQKARIAQSVETLSSMRDMARECRDILLAEEIDYRAFGDLLDRGWKTKRGLASGIATSGIDQAYARSLAAGAYGGKIAGAGGGGFLYLVVPPEKQFSVRAALCDMVDVPVEHDPRGARVLSMV